MRGNSCSEHDKISKYEFVGSCMAQVLSLSIFSRRPRPHCGKVHKSRDNKSRRTWKIWERVAEQVGVNHVSPLLPNLVHLFTLFARHSSQGRMKTAQGRILRGKTADIQGDSLGEWQMWSFEMSSPRSTWMCKVESRRCEKTTWRRTLVFLSFVVSTTVVFLPVRTNSLVPRFFTLVARFERGNRKEGNIVARLTRTETKRDFYVTNENERESEKVETERGNMNGQRAFYTGLSLYLIIERCFWGIPTFVEKQGLTQKTNKAEQLV